MFEGTERKAVSLKTETTEQSQVRTPPALYRWRHDDDDKLHTF